MTTPDSGAPMRSIQIPEEMYLKIEKLAKEADFPSVDSYVAFVLEEVVQGDEAVFSPAEEEKVKERLRNLGYL